MGAGSAIKGGRNRARPGSARVAAFCRRGGDGKSVKGFVGAALLLFASAASAQPAIPTATGNSAHDRLAGYSDKERNRAMDRLLRNFDHGVCDVNSTSFIEYHKGIASIWMASCRDGRRYVVKLMDLDNEGVAVFGCDESPEVRAYCDKQGP